MTTKVLNEFKRLKIQFWIFNFVSIIIAIIAIYQNELINLLIPLFMFILNIISFLHFIKNVKKDLNRLNPNFNSISLKKLCKYYS